MRSFLAKPANQVLMLAVACLLFVFIIRPWQLFFLNDDFLHIPLPNQWLFLRSGFLRPVPNFIVLFDKWLYGDKAIGFFCTTLVLHSGCVFVVYALTKKLVEVFTEKERFALWPFFTALLYLVYPFHAESIMWVIARVSIQATGFALLSLLFYIKSTEKPGHLFWSWLFFVIGLFAYESIWSIPLLFGILSVCLVLVNRSSWGKEILKFSLMVLTFLAFLAVRFWALGSLAGDGYPEINENLGYISLLLTNLVKLTGRNFTPPFPNTIYVVLFFGLSVILYSISIWLAWKRGIKHGLITSMLWVGLISGVITATTLGIDTHYNESERYIYFSSYFFCAFLGYILLLFNKKRIAGWWVAGLCLVFTVYLFRTQRNYAYASAITRSTVEMAKQYPDYRRAIFIDVPKKYKGTMILRMSLADAIEWLVPQNKYDSVKVHSRVETPLGILPYEIGEVEWKTLANQKGWNSGMAILPDSTGRMDTLQANDLLFWYGEKGIYKVNLP